MGGEGVQEERAVKDNNNKTELHENLVHYRNIRAES